MDFANRLNDIGRTTGEAGSLPSRSQYRLARAAHSRLGWQSDRASPLAVPALGAVSWARSRTKQKKVVNCYLQKLPQNLMFVSGVVRVQCHLQLCSQLCEDNDNDGDENDASWPKSLSFFSTIRSSTCRRVDEFDRLSKLAISSFRPILMCQCVDASDALDNESDNTASRPLLFACVRQPLVLSISRVADVAR